MKKVEGGDSLFKSLISCDLSPELAYNMYAVPHEDAWTWYGECKGMEHIH